MSSYTKKQRHTAKRIYDRLCEENGFTGAYTTVKDYVRAHRQKAREMFIPLAHPPGHGQADFGEAVVVLGGIEQKIHFFAFDLPHSDACYIRTYPAATSEAWMDGHVHAFGFFGAVSLSVVYDNDSCLLSEYSSTVIDQNFPKTKHGSCCTPLLYCVTLLCILN